MSENPPTFNRRTLCKLVAVSATAAAVVPRAMAETFAAPSPVDTGKVEQGAVKFPAWRGPADTPSAPPPKPLPPDQRVGFAIVGLGRLALEEILPAFGKSLKARPVALVSGSPEKLQTVAAQYGIKPQACYSYEDFDRIRDNPDVKVVYIVLPNAMHREFCERAAKAGKHVLTEKPMSVSSKDGQAMVDACRKAGVKLMVAYRIQYEPYNRRAMTLVRSKQYGRLVAYQGINTQTVAADGDRQWRHKKQMAGGGSLVDIGLYCLNTARFITGEEPVEVYANIWSPPGDPRFAEVEETVQFTLRFPSHTVANCLTSYGARDDKHQHLNLEGAAIDMPNAFLYEGQRMSIIDRDDDATRNAELTLQPKDQFAQEIDHMADCVLTGREPYTPGEEGVQDHKLMEAIYESARTGQPVKLAPIEGLDHFRGPPLA
ncbi:Gfo/Idh/MocA family protein [Pseudomonas japonica]|uniref:Gfo/Idh/MocA family protein n=1 Tax=Pseudomonas japonica TaxID=256466 RepID=UPI0015E29ECF|nr:Gfo/Idh/MocA family oxidoreductase [Pseudomonas japonica]MBA1244156.1 Gfo/Idh/MocA family oxidoreductase [Pseudomonas japonica]